MDTTLLRKAGLTDSQAKGYLALMQFGALTPAELAIKTGESRTNAYAITDKLLAYGLASKTNERKSRYTANHPAAVEALAERRRKVLVKNELEVKRGLGSLIEMFYRFSELPGTRTLEGLDGIKDVYQDTLNAKQTIYLVRTTADDSCMGIEYFAEYRQKRASLGIHTYALMPDTPAAQAFAASGQDEPLLIHRTPLPKAAYTAPVEMDVYGDKVAFISFGETQMATIIQSPPIAEAMRQILHLLTVLLNQDYPSAA